MYNYLEEFMNHQLLIDIKDATNEELYELDEIINMPYASGDRIYERIDYRGEHRYLHCRVRTDKAVGLTYSSIPVDVFHEFVGMKHISYQEFLSSFSHINISENDIDNLFKE